MKTDSDRSPRTTGETTKRGESLGLAWIPILILPDGTVEEPPEDEPLYYRRECRG